VKPPPPKSSRAELKGEGADGSRSGGAFFAPRAEETAPTEAKTAEQGTNNTAGAYQQRRGGRSRARRSLVGGGECERARELLFIPRSEFQWGAYYDPPIE
jgi:hypothetical protein